MDNFDAKLTPEFNRRAADAAPDNAFLRYIQNILDRTAAEGIAGAFERLQLPLPEKGEFLFSSEDGAVVLLSAYGIVLRVNNRNNIQENWHADRIGKSAWLLEPLGAFDSGSAVIEVLPAVLLEDRSHHLDFIYDRLLSEGLWFHDKHLRNMGRVPVTTAHFPDGVPVVLDRGAVEEMTPGVIALRPKPLPVFEDNLADEAQGAIDALYAPLRAALTAAWENPARVADFKALCKKYVTDGKLVAGWKDPGKDPVLHMDAARAEKHADVYTQRLKELGP